MSDETREARMGEALQRAAGEPELSTTDARAAAETEEETAESALELEPELARHPGPAQYVMVAVVLGIATLFEVALFYITAIPRTLLIVMLLGLGAFKFALVVLWFMHLRFDNVLFRRVFVGGLVLAFTLYLIVLVIFSSLRALWLILLALGLVTFVVLSLVRLERRRVRAETMVVDAAGSEHG
jgi:cytochrome c oxidase subunit IV